MFDSLYPEATSRALNEAARRRYSVPEPGIFTGFWQSALDAVRVAPLEATRAGLPLLEAFGRAQAVTYGAPIPADVFERDPSIDMTIRREIERMTPDPLSTGVASQIVFGAGKVLSKAAGYGLVGGLPGAVIGTGLDEGINESLRLTDKGVDTATAAKVGAVHGVVTAASILAPVAGRTALQTAGLVAVAGPGAFMVENLAAREILKAADYAEIARQYDPLDPVGLAVATLIPGAVGTAAHAVRIRRARTENAPTEDEIAAARQVLDAEHVNRSSLADRGDLEAANAHVDAIETARRQLDADEPVAVAEQVRADPDVAAAVEARIADAMPAVREAAQAILAETAEPAPAKPRRPVPLDDSRLQEPDYRKALETMVGEAGWAERGGHIIRDPSSGEVTARTRWIPHAEWYQAMQQRPDARLPGGRTGVESAVRRALAGEALGAQERRAVRFMLDEHQEFLRQMTEAAAPERAPEVARALDTLDEIGDITVPTGEYDAAGQPLMVSARELLKQSAADLSRASQEGRAFDAAINCFLRHAA